MARCYQANHTISLRSRGDHHNTGCHKGRDFVLLVHFMGVFSWCFHCLFGFVLRQDLFRFSFH